MSTEIERRVQHSANLINALLECYDRLQDLEYLVRGAYLAVDNIDDPDSLAAAQVVKAVEWKLSDIMEKLTAANNADLAALGVSKAT